MLIKCIFALILAVIFFYRVARDSAMVVKQLNATAGELLYYEALNRRVLLSLIVWIAGVIYWENFLLVGCLILYEILAYVVILTLSMMVYRFYVTNNQSNSR